MKIKVIAISALLAIIIFNLLACSPAPRIPVAGSARAQDMLTLLPVETSAFLVVDWNRLMNLNLVKKSFEEENLEPYRKKLEAFVNLKTDIYFVALAVAGDLKKAPENLLLLVNLKYNREKLLPVESESESSLENYNGIPYFPFVEIEESAIGCLAFLDDSNLAIGSEKAIKKAIEVYHGKQPNLLTSKEIKPYLKDINLKALTYGLTKIPADFFRPESQPDPYLKLIENTRLVSSFSDYRQGSYLTEIKIYSSDKKQHQKMAETLAGLKALGLGLSGESPEIAQALNSLEITASDRYVKVFISLEEELIEKLKKTLITKTPGVQKTKRNV
jgi:hypothetical protein